MRTEIAASLTLLAMTIKGLRIRTLHTVIPRKNA